MSESTWSAVDAYITDLFEVEDEVLRATLESTRLGGLPPIQVSAPQGRFLYLLALALGARRVLEVGTLAGYSAICLGRALPPNGRLVTLELDARHAEVARRNLAAAGLAEVAEVVVGPALETLGQLAARDEAPFDLVFIDADKENYPGYLEWAVRLCRPGGLIAADNVVREGAVADPSNDDPRVVGVRRCLEMAAADERLTGTVLQTVGSKGYDGLAVLLRR